MCGATCLGTNLADPPFVSGLAKPRFGHQSPLTDHLLRNRGLPPSSISNAFD